MTIPEVKRTFKRGGQVKLALASTFYSTLEEFNKGRTHKERALLASKCIPINIPHKQIKVAKIIAAEQIEPPIDFA